MKNIIFIIFSVLPFTQALACMRTPDGDFAIAGSYTSGQQVYHGQTTDFEYGSCKKYAGQYIVLVTAPTYTDPQFKSISAPEGELSEERCYINNSPFNVSKPDDIGIESFYRSETSFLNSCLEAEVTDARGEIDVDSQVNCEVNKVASNKAIVKGPRCAFKIYENSSFSVHYRLNPSCLSLSYLKEKGDIRPMDAKASIAVYKSLNLIQGSTEYDILNMINARVTLQPGSDLIPVAKYAGTVGSEWPMQYGAQVEFGKVVLSRTLRLHAAPYVFLRTPFMVNNNCPEVCKNGFCTSPCDFYAPVAARMILKRKAVGESTFHAIDYWYQGNLVPARFLGELSFGRALPDQKFNVGDMYLLEAEFSNPALTYKTITDEAKQLLIKLAPVSIPTGAAGRPTGLEGLGTLEGTNIVPLNPVLLGLGSIREEQTSTAGFLSILNSMIGTDDSWPPYYTSIINGDQTDNPNRIFLKLKVGFRISSVSTSGPVMVDQVEYSKESKIFGNNRVPMLAPPQIKCSL